VTRKSQRNGQIVGAALVSHHPGLTQDKAFRVRAGDGRDSDLIAGYERLRDKLDAVRPDVLVIIDTHWFTTGYHLIDAGASFEGEYTSDEMPWYLKNKPYKYDGVPHLAHLCQEVAEEQGVMAMAVDEPGMGRQYATINIVNAIGQGEPVLSVSCCQNARSENFLQMGKVLGEAIRRGGQKVVILASGALSHRFVNIDWQQVHPRIYHPDNVSSAYNRESDLRAIELFKQGRHDLILERFDEEYRQTPWEALGGHYLQMIGALGAQACRARGEPLCEYENARGTGNIHIWFEVDHERT